MNLTDPFLAAEKTWYRSPKAEKWMLFAADIVAFAVAYLSMNALLQVIRLHDIVQSQSFLSLDRLEIKYYSWFAAFGLVAFWVKGHYSKRAPFWNEVREVLKAAAVLAGVEVGAAFLTKSSFSRAALLVSWCLVPCFILLLRTTVKVALLRAGGWLRPMVIIGWGENAIETALAFEGERLMGYSLLAVLVPNGRDKKLTEFVTRSGHTVPFLPLESDPDLTLKYLGEPHVVMALEQGGIDTYQHLIQDLGRRNRSIQIVPSIRGLPLYGMEVGHFFAHEVLLLSVRNNLRRPVPQLVKRAFDIVVSASLLIIGLPLFAWISLKVAASGRPIFYGHRRHGQNNQTFLCYKFRTMAPNADKLLEDLLARDADAKAEWERDFKLKNDPRITTIGRFLRRTSLDELPQLWNVLKGDMSLVGPRPVVGAELERYGSQVDYYLEAKPGITGLWQISGRNDITYDSRVYLDSWYVKNWSLFNDIVILLKTVKVIFRKDGAY